MQLNRSDSAFRNGEILVCGTEAKSGHRRGHGHGQKVANRWQLQLEGAFRAPSTASAKTTPEAI
jgi:hypothetical protein